MPNSTLQYSLSGSPDGLLTKWQKERTKKSRHNPVSSLMLAFMPAFSAPSITDQSRLNLADIFLQDAIAVGVTQLAECLRLDLTNPFASDIKDLTDFFQRLHPTVI